MPQLEAYDIDLSNPEERMDVFRSFSRQVLYMALFDNEEREFSIFEEALTDEEAELEAEDEGEEEERNNRETLRRFGRYVHRQMGDDFSSPEELSIDEWVELAQDVLAKPEQKRNLPALADKIYHLLKQELRLERERQIRRKMW